MMRRNRWKIAAVWAVCAAMILFVFISGIFDTYKVWPDVKLDCAGGDGLWRLEDGDAHGVVASGPYYALPAGLYRIKWQIEGDGENRISFSCSNNALIQHDEIVTRPEQWQDEAWFEIKEPTHSFSINVEFASGTWMQMHNLRLYSPEYRDRAFTFAALLILLCTLLTRYLCGRLSRLDMQEFALLAVGVLFASLLCLGVDTPVGDDTHFHAARIMNLADGLRSGQMPARVGGFSYNGYGAMTSVFYPDLLLYPFALLVLGGASITYVMNAVVVVTNALTAWCMLYAGRRLTGNRQAAVCASVLYLLCGYRMMDIYVRMAQGELLAMTFVPLFIVGLYEVIWGDKNRWPVLAIGATLVFRSHVLTTLLCAICALTLGVVYIGRIIRKRRLGVIALACLATLMINLNQIVPLVMCYAEGVNTSVMQFGFAETALTLRELLGSERYLGFAMIFGAAAFICALEDKQDRPARRILWRLMLAGTACCVLATDWIPWSQISLLTGGLIETLQFPWRFLLLAAACFALCGGDGAARLLRRDGMQAAMLTLVIAVMCSVPHLEGMASRWSDMEFGLGAKTFMPYPEYQIEGTDAGETRSRAVIMTDGVLLTEYEKDGTRISAKVDAKKQATLMFPLFGFPGYAAELNGEKMDWTLGDNNRLTLSLPAGTQGELHIWYEGKVIWRVMDVISLVSVLGLAGYSHRKRRYA